MSENSEFEAQEQPGTEPAPAVEGDSGQYVDGDYGKAGIAREDEAEAAREGEYPEGDFGAAGTIEEPARTVEGEYEAGDYGSAGTAGENLVTVEEAEYPDGDYGSAGTTGAADGVGAAGTAGVPTEHRLVEDEVSVEDDDEDEDLPRDPA